jgi:hypothetical protein
VHSLEEDEKLAKTNVKKGASKVAKTLSELTYSALLIFLKGRQKLCRDFY